MQNPFLNRKNTEIHGKYKKNQKNLENPENPEPDIGGSRGRRRSEAAYICCSSSQTVADPIRDANGCQGVHRVPTGAAGSNWYRWAPTGNGNEIWKTTISMESPVRFGSVRFQSGPVPVPAVRFPEKIRICL